MLTGRGFPRAVRRALRSSGVARATRRRRDQPLPPELRARLLAIPVETSPPRLAVASRPRGADFDSSWLLASPLAPLIASFLVAVAVSLLFGNPYRMAAATVVEVRSEVSPAAHRLRDRASRLAVTAADLSGAAVQSLPRAGRSASRVISQTLKDRIDSRDRGAS